jgi:excisionase family DNA binding protein
MKRELVPLKEATLLRPWLSERFARRLVAERRIAFHRVGGRILFDLRDLDDFAEAGRIEAFR